MTRIGRFWAYLRLTLLAAVALFVLITVWANRGYRTDFWFGRRFEQVPTLWLIALSAAAAVLVFAILARVRGVLRDVAAARDDRRQAHQAVRQRELTDALAAQERRIDAKLRQAVGPGAAAPPGDSRPGTPH
ncbi:MAG: hypothetical protein U1A27_03565 [Phycisphaerae bacterium]